MIIQRSSDSIAIPPDSSRYDPSNNHPQSAKNVKSSLTHCIWKLQSAKQNRSLESGNINVTHTHTHTHTQGKHDETKSRLPRGSWSTKQQNYTAKRIAAGDNSLRFLSRARVSETSPRERIIIRVRGFSFLPRLRPANDPVASSGH